MPQQTQSLESATSASFQFKGEDHTLGNILRYMLAKHPDVDFSAYTIPHPSEPYMNMRVQTNDAGTAWGAVADSLGCISDVCDVLERKWLQAQKKQLKKDAQMEVDA